MCYKVKVVSDGAKLEISYNAILEAIGKVVPKLEIVSGFEHPMLPVISCENPGKIVFMRWGLIPSWIKNEGDAMEIANRTLNARAESLFEKPSFKSILTRRCLIPVDGFYEWQQEGKRKTPYFIRTTGDGPFSLGGMYDEWINTATGEIVKSFSIITVAANPLMERIHNVKKRMPLILRKEDEKRWIDASLDAEAIKSMLVQYPESLMIADVYEKKSPDEKRQDLTLF